MKYMKELYKMNKIFKKYGKKIEKTLDKYGKEAVKLVEEEAPKFLEYAKQKIDGFDKIIEDMGGIGEVFKMLWSTEEEAVDLLTMEMIISWCKESLPKGADKAVVLRLNAEEFMVDDEYSKYHYRYLACFLDENEEMIGSRMKYFYTNTIEERLTEAFGDKDMIILR